MAFDWRGNRNPVASLLVRLEHQRLLPFEPSQFYQVAYLKLFFTCMPTTPGLKTQFGRRDMVGPG